MKLETTKSFILIVLIGTSLLLTFGLWSYQPSNERLNSPTLLNEVVLNGKEETKKDIIEPSSIIFHTEGSHFSFENPLDRQSLYRDMQSWVMYDFRSLAGREREPANDEVEVIFPTAIPMEILSKVFTFNDDIVFPNMSVKQMYFTFDSEPASLQVHFLSENGQKQAVATINDSKSYQQLWSEISTLKGLEEYFLFNDNYSPIYLPEEKINLEQQSFSVSNINAKQLVDVLFKDPSLVRSNISETYFKDSERGMHVDPDISMEYFIPFRTESERMNPLNLLENSINNINDHKGWTEEYNLSEIKTAANSNSVHYQMYYEGYPVYNSADLSFIKQEWRGQLLTKYERPLFYLSDYVSGGQIELSSGHSVIDYLEDNSNYKLENIQDIQLGYRLHYEKNDSLVTLKPTWYMNYSGHWIEVKLEEDIQQIKGGD